MSGRPPRSVKGLVAITVALIAAGALVLRPDATSPDTAGPATAEADDLPAADSGGRDEQRTPAPDVTFERFDGGGPVHLDNWNGEAVVVNFWASWCPPCVAEMRDAFEPLHQDLGDRVVFLGVNLQDTEADARAVIEQTGVTYELAHDHDGELFTAFGGFGMPTTALLDEDGSVVASHTGAISRGELETLVLEHLLDG